MQGNGLHGHEKLNRAELEICAPPGPAAWVALAWQRVSNLEELWIDDG
jgi:hypothetical protein